MSNIFEIACRYKYRFPFNGVISSEDLWDLTVEKLDSIFKTLNSEKKQVNEESLLNEQTNEDKELDVKIEIIKYIVNFKLEAEQLREKTVERKAQKQKLLEVWSKKQDESLNNMSMDEIQEALDKLD